MNHFFKSLVIGFMIIGLIMLSERSVSASAQNQTAGENMAGGGNQNMTAQGTGKLNSMVDGNQSSAGATAPGYVQVRSTREVNASADQVLEYFMNIQALPRFHPEFIKNVTILEQQANNITFKQEASFFGNNVSSINKLAKLPSNDTVIIETINGSGKGSKFSLTWQETSPNRTRITLNGEFVFQSPPGRPLDDVIRMTAEKRLDEDVIHIEQLSSPAK
ncbi:MAG: SRPBCC family protein [Thermoproteota archaeon]|nr:SRPBCC family protein [Thermoproteota archaeon]